MAKRNPPGAAAASGIWEAEEVAGGPNAAATTASAATIEARMTDEEWDNMGIV
ncbi:hypothetical protein ASA1KI_10460 [Opitutales bacterium ASA1]|nr:hypothetical protein ASA1KI_10460 [Opitutales bacterium ASA1]